MMMMKTNKILAIWTFLRLSVGFFVTPFPIVPSFGCVAFLIWIYSKQSKKTNKTVLYSNWYSPCTRRSVHFFFLESTTFFSSKSYCSYESEENRCEHTHTHETNLKKKNTGEEKEKLFFVSRRSHTVHLTRTVFVSAYVSEYFVVVPLLLFSVVVAVVVFLFSSVPVSSLSSSSSSRYVFLRFSLLKRKIVYIMPTYMYARARKKLVCMRLHRLRHRRRRRHRRCRCCYSAVLLFEVRFLIIYHSAYV